MIARRIVPLLALAVFLNYFDRGTLSTAGPLVARELALSNAEMGILFSAFFWSYAPLQPLAGWVAQRFDLRHVLGGGLALWGLATALTGFATGFWSLLALRVLLGIGESVAYPCNAKFMSQHVPIHERGKANGLIAAGQAFGPLLGMLIGGLAMSEYGWRAAFLVFGVSSLLWLLPWHQATRGGTRAAEIDDSAAIPYAALLRERALWGTALGHFAGNWAYYFTITWLPLLLVREHGFTMAQMAVVGACVYGAQALAAPATGWWCDRVFARGGAPNRTLKGAMHVGLGGVAVAMAICTVAQPSLMIAAILLAGLFFGAQSAPLGTITQTLAGPHAGARWMGIQNLCANMAGVLAPLVTGFAVDATGSFFWAFAVAALVTLFGIAAYAWVIRDVAPVQWPLHAGPQRETVDPQRQRSLRTPDDLPRS